MAGASANASGDEVLMSLSIVQDILGDLEDKFEERKDELLRRYERHPDRYDPPRSDPFLSAEGWRPDEEKSMSTDWGSHADTERRGPDQTQPPSQRPASASAPVSTGPVDRKVAEIETLKDNADADQLETFDKELGEMFPPLPRAIPENLCRLRCDVQRRLQALRKADGQAAMQRRASKTQNKKKKKKKEEEKETTRKGKGSGSDSDSSSSSSSSSSEEEGSAGKNLTLQALRINRK